ncbi:MAG: hypothetical protein ACJ76Z_05425, partial [Thermoleophilaceae bacterium]
PMPAAALLNALELLRARRTWLRLFRLVLAGARTRGWVESGGSGVPGDGAPLEDVDLDSDVAIPIPHVAVPTLCLKRDGEQLGTLAPRRAQWYGRLAEEAARRLAVVWWADRGNRWWTRLPGAGAAGLQAVPEVADTTGALLVRGQDWAAIDAEIRQSGAHVAAIPLPRVASGDSWLGAVVPALEGARVACVVGAGLAPDEPPAPLVLHSRATLGEPYPTSVGHPPQYIAVRRDAYEALGGFDPATARLGIAAPVLDFLDRALNAGFVVGYRDTPGLDPAGRYRPARSRNEWERWSAAGALLLRATRRSPGIGPWVRLVARFLEGSWSTLVAGRSGRRWWLGSRLALLAGCLRCFRG